MTIQDRVTIHAPVNKVWEAIRDPGTHAQWHPFVTRISGGHGLGAIRKCDVKVGTKSGQTEERCSGYQQERTITWLIERDTTGFSQMVSDWTAGFTLEAQPSNGVVVIAQSAFRPKNLLVRLAMPLIRRKFHQTQQSILSALKQFVEAH